MRRLALVLGVLFLVAGGWWWWNRPLPPDPLVEVGRRIFLEGRLPDGSITKAVAYQDVPLSGRQVSCASCHGRSGMGATETGTRTPPITAPMLFNPAQRPRGPIYSTSTMARALRAGIDSAGTPLSPLMPRYSFTDAEVEALVHYLRTLYAEAPPGLEEHQVSIATAISDEIPRESREAVLSVLQRFVDDHNADIRNEAGRDRSRIEGGRTRKLYREWSLDPWILKGTPESWPSQLEGYMDDHPVFAMVGGLSTYSWETVGAFCEAQQMPCLFPTVDRAPTRPGDFYTLYFSDGTGTEARVMVGELKAAGALGKVVQVVGERPEDAAKLVEEGVRAAGGQIQTLVSTDPSVGTAAEGATALVLWTGGIPIPEGPRVLVSGSRWEERSSLPSGAWVVDARASHREKDAGLLRFRAWAKGRSLDVPQERLQAQAWFAAASFVDGMEHIAAHPGRTYLLDTLDHSTGLAALIPGYPQGEFGPGQRTISKGAWVIPMDPSASPRWVIP